jgi:hypothetical protein
MSAIGREGGESRAASQTRRRSGANEEEIGTSPKAAHPGSRSRSDGEEELDDIEDM